MPGIVALVARDTEAAVGSSWQTVRFRMSYEPSGLASVSMVARDARGAEHDLDIPDGVGTLVDDMRREHAATGHGVWITVELIVSRPTGSARIDYSFKFGY